MVTDLFVVVVAATAEVAVVVGAGAEASTLPLSLVPVRVAVRTTGGAAPLVCPEARPSGRVGKPPGAAAPKGTVEVVVAVCPVWAWTPPVTDEAV